MSQSLRVLVVEDTAESAALRAEALREGGYEPVVERVATEAEMRAALRGESWDIVLCGDSLENFDAARALRALRESVLAIPLVVVAGSESVEAAIEAIKLGAGDYVPGKNPGRLAPAVKCALAESAGRRAGEDRLAEALTREKELVREARASERAKSEFLALMTHEIRQPMNGVLGFAEMLCNAPNLPPECRNYAQTILQSGEALMVIVDEMLGFVQLEEGGVVAERQPFSPRKLLQEIRAQLASVAADKLLRLSTIVDEDVPGCLIGDATRLRQILLNLAGNAIKFTESGSVTLGIWPLHESASGAPRTFEFSVKDTGAGIAAVQMERIFQPFASDADASRRGNGAGAALSICRRLAESLGGTLTVRSQPGVGSEFLLEMPLGESEQPLESGADSLGALDATFAARHPLRILLVEDDVVSMKLILALVRRLGYDPVAAQNGHEAVETYLSEQPDCILVDLQMPEMDGIEATMKIRALERAAGKEGRAFVAALTANVFPAERRRCFDAGMNGYLNKPVKLTSLARTLVQACELAHDVAAPRGRA